MRANELFKAHVKRAKERSASINPLALLHFEMCKAVGGWVPYDEFMYLPLEVPLQIRELNYEVNKAQEKDMKNRMRKGRSVRP